MTGMGMIQVRDAEKNCYSETITVSKIAYCIAYYIKFETCFMNVTKSMFYIV